VTLNQNKHPKPFHICSEPNVPRTVAETDKLNESHDMLFSTATCVTGLVTEEASFDLDKAPATFSSPKYQDPTLGPTQFSNECILVGGGGGGRFK
jgi:hypothetical protein